MEAIISQIINEIRQYQKNKNIKNMCVTNVAFLYNTIIGFGFKNIKAKSAISVYIDIDKKLLRICAGHILLLLDDIIIEPSYDIYCHSDVKYFFTIKELMNYIKNINYFITEEFNLKFIIEKNIKFMEIEKQINYGDVIGDPCYYTELENHILDKMKHYIALA
jgi:hypothetical protein